MTKREKRDVETLDIYVVRDIIDLSHLNNNNNNNNDNNNDLFIEGMTIGQETQETHNTKPEDHPVDGYYSYIKVTPLQSVFSYRNGTDVGQKFSTHHAHINEGENIFFINNLTLR
ncbi:hypothetical protein Pcinc_041405 [Petrolisthes cinctipes]|uniref:Uncharacterized protein n=1 Tax=Petrolisthes cinctipes TaxID=88211 RepID=A0AAE1BJM4_PETCI|nr:hypothetical protein Pcinc_041405 [Petrolisthes cinctipes]